MTDCVLDASAVIAFLFDEEGSAVVRPLLRGGLISSVNAGEVIFRTFKNGISLQRQVQEFRNLEMHVIDFDMDQAEIAATFKPYTSAANLSFADRACLALGVQRGLPIITAERALSKVIKGHDIRLIREGGGQPS